MHEERTKELGTFHTEGSHDYREEISKEIVKDFISICASVILIVVFFVLVFIIWIKENGK